jgi:hypothetical protein
MLRDAIDAWLDALPPSAHPYCSGKPTLTKEDRRVLADDPPLFFFLLLEAAVDENGERLGFVGSVITAEVIVAALRASRARGSSLVLSDEVFGGKAPRTMPDLIQFLARAYGFGPGDVPFI